MFVGHVIIHDEIQVLYVSLYCPGVKDSHAAGKLLPEVSIALLRLNDAKS